MHCPFATDFRHRTLNVSGLVVVDDGRDPSEATCGEFGNYQDSECCARKWAFEVFTVRRRAGRNADYLESCAVRGATGLLAHIAQTLRRQSTSVSRLRHRVAARNVAKRSRCLQASPVFSSLTDASIGAIVDAMEFEIAEAGGAALCVEGEEADRMFLLMSGACDVFVGQDQVGRLKRLDVFGEAALFPDESGSFTRTATVRVAEGEPAKLLVLQKSALDKLVKSGVMHAQCSI